MAPITLSINPTYLCNFRCEFCYLTTSQLSDTQLLPVNQLSKMLKEVSAHSTIGHVDLYGGEIGVLDDDYLQDLKRTIRDYYSGTINVITNLSRVPAFFLDPDIQLSVSYDFAVRERHERVYSNMSTLSKPVHVLLLASRHLILENVEYMILMLNALKNVHTVEIKPYSNNQANAQNVSHAEYENFIKRWITSPIPKQFEFTNTRQIENCISSKYNAYSDDHVYITPSGRFAVLEFDQRDKEHFTEYDRFEDVIEWSNREKELIKSNPVCSKCQYVGHCLTEHYRWVTDNTQSCDGHLHLLEWYRDRMEK